MWQSRTKNDLIIEVWEKLDCENVGAVEIEAISVAVEGEYGASAVDSPMIIARLLAGEGAELRHSEIMSLYVERKSDRPYDAAFRNILAIDDLKSTARSLRKLENLRRRYLSENDREGLRLVRETALRGKLTAEQTAERKNIESTAKLINIEIAAWLTIWIQTPEIFDTWLDLRRGSPEYLDKFGDSTV